MIVFMKLLLICVLPRSFSNVGHRSGVFSVYRFIWAFVRLLHGLVTRGFRVGFLLEHVALMGFASDLDRLNYVVIVFIMFCYFT